MRCQGFGGRTPLGAGPRQDRREVIVRDCLLCRGCGVWEGLSVLLWVLLGRERLLESPGGVWRSENSRLLMSKVGVHAPRRPWEEGVGCLWGPWQLGYSQEHWRAWRAVRAEEGGEAWVHGKWASGLLELPRRGGVEAGDSSKLPERSL